MPWPLVNPLLSSLLFFLRNPNFILLMRLGGCFKANQHETSDTTLPCHYNTTIIPLLLLLFLPFPEKRAANISQCMSTTEAPIGHGTVILQLRIDGHGHAKKGGEFFRLRLDTTVVLVVQRERECLPRERLASLRSPSTPPLCSRCEEVGQYPGRIIDGFWPCVDVRAKMDILIKGRLIATSPSLVSLVFGSLSTPRIVFLMQYRVHEI